MDPTLEQLAARSAQGDRAALEQLIRRVQNRIYGLAVRMLGDVEAAQDATQEIILRAVTHLGSFRGEGTFISWVLKVAASHLINVKAGKREAISFEALEQMLEQGIALYEQSKPETPFEDAVIREGKLLCTQGMLLCLDREHRLAFVLGEVLELPGAEAAEILDIDEAAFRKRLSRARERIEAFAQSHCGLVNAKNPCRCEKQAHLGVKLGVIDPKKLELANHPHLARAAAQVEQLVSAAAVLRSHPEYSAPDVFVSRVRELLDAAP
jgi:RNA polymerase sigma factor (sigma-70 family)